MKREIYPEELEALTNLMYAKDGLEKHNNLYVNQIYKCANRDIKAQELDSPITMHCYSELKKMYSGENNYVDTFNLDQVLKSDIACTNREQVAQLQSIEMQLSRIAKALEEIARSKNEH